MRQLLDVVESLYAAGADSRLWRSALEKVSDWVGTAEAALGVSAVGQIPWLEAPRTDPEYLKSYPDYWRDDIVWQRIVGRGTGNAVADAMVLVGGELKRNAFQHEWSAPQAYHHRLGSLLLDDAQSKAVLILPCAREVEQDQVDRLNMLLPHMRRALQFSLAMSQNESLANASAALIENSGKSYLITDCLGRVLQHSAPAERWLRADRDMIVRIGELARKLVATDIAVPKSPTPVELAPDVRLCHIPLYSASKLQLPGCPAILFYEAPIGDNQRIGMLRRRYSLTEAEARLALELRQGDGRRAAARRRGITDATARAHMSTIFAKIGVSRQAELVRVISNMT